MGCFHVFFSFSLYKLVFMEIGILGWLSGAEPCAVSTSTIWNHRTSWLLLVGFLFLPPYHALLHPVRSVAKVCPCKASPCFPFSNSDLWGFMSHRIGDAFFSFSSLGPFHLFHFTEVLPYLFSLISISHPSYYIYTIEAFQHNIMALIIFIFAVFGLFWFLFLAQ